MGFSLIANTIDWLANNQLKLLAQWQTRSGRQEAIPYQNTEANAKNALSMYLYGSK